jgi:hypothetical protein
MGPPMSPLHEALYKYCKNTISEQCILLNVLTDLVLMKHWCSTLCQFIGVRPKFAHE